ncbi:ligand-binding sensor domain-containing diguanylate cyclase [Acidipila sp. EB88]|uniref:ligand-binding sensor domain-containing diguanylate cyclase n=1 Tax=Acidipila sp. EB88 TaxID=2305226 RepID=UPI0013150C22|nr:ligand-binding sensor domain-containing diguanylate cyclase [Acidipila sp. EB88]
MTFKHVDSVPLSPASRGSLLAVILLVLLAFSGGVARAQSYTFAHFGQEDGLLNPDASAIVQDKRGVLWVGTENGVFRADGNHFVQVQSFADAVFGAVLAMHVDGAGRVWVMGAKRLVYFDNNGALHEVPDLALNVVLDESARLASLPDQPNTLFMLHGGLLQEVHSNDGNTGWTVQTALPEAQLHDLPQPAEVHSLVADPKRHVIWAGCGKALCALRPPGSESADPGSLLEVWDGRRNIPADTWSRLLLAHDGSLWARSAHDVIRLDPETWQVTHFGNPSPHVVQSFSEPALVEDPDGGMIANTTDGLARLTNGHWQQLSSANGLPSSEIATMFFDRKGGFWLSPVGQGMWRWLGYKNWQNWTRSAGMAGDVAWSTLRDPKGRLWATSTNDVNLIDEAAGRVIPQNGGKAVGAVQTMTADARGHLWLGGNDGILMDFDPATRQTRSVARDLGYIYAVRADLGGGAGVVAGQRVWICTATGVGYVSSEDGWTHTHMLHGGGAPPSNAWSMAEAKDGTFWFSAAGGLYRLVNGTWSHVVVPDGTSLIDYPAMYVAADQTLWIQAALPHPLLHLRLEGNRAVIIGSVSSDIVATDDLSFITIDHRGWMWVGSDLGIYAFDGKRWVHCTQEDGLLSDDTDTSGVYEDRDGSMWFATVSGVSHLLHPAQLFDVATPTIDVQDVRINGHKLEPGKNPNFNLRAPELSVDLFSTNYQRPRAVVFLYRLSGREDDWQATGPGTLHFSGLRAGEYTLSLQAMDKRVHAFSTPIEYSFTVLPPWYRRDRSKVLALTLLMLLIAGGWRLSLRNLKRNEALLQQKVDLQTAQLLAEKQELERAQSRLVETARRDALTGLLNRSAIFDVLARMRRVALAAKTPLSVVMADLDHFKSINDRYGHTIGDVVLRECAARLRETLRPGDAVGRYGGEELLIAIPGLDAEHAIARLEEVRAAIASRPIIHGELVLYVTCSYGVAWVNHEQRDLEALVHAADEALYVAKQNGRNRVEFASPDSPHDSVLGRELPGKL